MEQLTIVSQRVFSLNLERQSDFSSQMEHMVGVQEQLVVGHNTNADRADCSLIIKN